MPPRLRVTYQFLADGQAYADPFNPAGAGGDRMRPSPGGPGRPLKNLFQERGVPAWQRDVPLLFAGDRLIYVPRLGVNRDIDVPDGATSGAAAWRRIEWRPDLLIA